MASKHAGGRLARLHVSSSIFLLCDMQLGLRPYTWRFTEIAAVAKNMVTAANILGIPLIATEHKGYGSTVTEIDVSHAKVFSKECFTMVTPEVEEEMKKHPDRKSVVLFGIMTDCCILQTALDLLATGYEVCIVADACSTKSQASWQFSIEHLRQVGAVIMNCMATLYELIKGTDHPQFKKIEKLVDHSIMYSDRLLSKL